jgi:hypothetical protein
MSFSATISFDETLFRGTLPFFNNAQKYTTAQLAAAFSMASSYVSTCNTSWMINGADLQNALFLMTAHILGLQNLINENGGTAPALVKQAEIDKVNVSLNMPPMGTQFQWWMNLTPWGAQLLALLGVKSAGGFYIGGLPERAAFRRVAGGFGGRRWI